MTDEQCTSTEQDTSSPDDTWSGHMRLRRRRWDDLVHATILESEKRPWQDIAQDRTGWQAMAPALIARVLRRSQVQLAPVPRGRDVVEMEESRQNLTF